MSDRFYCPDRPVDGRARLEGDEARHLIKVRRVAVGESVELFDGRGHRYRAEVATLGRDLVDLAVLALADPDPAPALALTLATAVPKGDRFDWLIEKATELGVARLIPLVTERSSVDPRSAKLERLRRVVIEASKQSRRDRLMDLDPPTPWSSLVESPGSGLRLLAHPGGRPIAAVGPELSRGSALVAIGPEGGFTPAEVGRAEAAGWGLVGLGPTVLRVETAAIAATAALLAAAEAFRGSSGHRGEF